jgi:dimethylaniline monooxygenase (N-oxide forming)
MHKDIVKKCKEGSVTPKPGLKMIEGKRVHFVDGTSQDIDLLVACTGRFPSVNPSTRS